MIDEASGGACEMWSDFLNFLTIAGIWSAIQKLKFLNLKIWS